MRILTENYNILVQNLYFNNVEKSRKCGGRFKILIKLRPMSDTQQSRANLSRNFIA